MNCDEFTEKPNSLITVPENRDPVLFQEIDHGLIDLPCIYADNKWFFSFLEYLYDPEGRASLTEKVFLVESSRKKRLHRR